MNRVETRNSSGPDIAHLHFGSDGSPVLRGARCTECDTVYFPPTGVCPHCGSPEQAEEDLPRSGQLYSETTVHVAPKPWSTPYSVGYVDLSNGVRVFAHLTGGPQIGDTVNLATGVVGADADGAPVHAFVFQKEDK